MNGHFTFESVINSWGMCSDENTNSGALLSFDVVCTSSPVTIMHLSMSCPACQPWVGWGNTGDLTKSSVKFPSTGTKKLVKPHMSPPRKRGFYRRFDLSIKINFGSVNCHCQKPQDVDVKSPVGVWGSSGVGLDIDMCIMLQKK